MAFVEKPVYIPILTDAEGSFSSLSSSSVADRVDRSPSPSSPPLKVFDCRTRSKLFRRAGFSSRTKTLLAAIVGFMVLFLAHERNLINMDRSSVRGNTALPAPLPTRFSPPFSYPPMDMPASAAVETQPRIFDIILLNDELSVLDIRLNELDSVVDMFVIVEATTTFTGIPKTLHYQTHQRDFARFWHKIIHVVLSPPTDDEIQQDNLDINNPWQMEKRSRDKGLATALNIYRPEEGDWILLSDLDEIPRPSVLKAMKEQDTSTSLGAIFADQHRSQNSGGDLFRLETRFYYYSYEFRHRNSDWVGPVVVRYREADSPALVTNGRSDLDRNQVSQIGVIQSMIESNWKTAGSKMRDARNSHYATYISDAGWHCTWCFSTVSAVISKVTAYSHREHNQGQFKELSWILDRFSKGLDLFDRENENYDYVSDENDVPAYIAANREKFSYMLHRWEQPNAGFTDLEPDNPEVVARKKTMNAENEVKDKNVSIGDATEKS